MWKRPIPAIIAATDILWLILSAVLSLPYCVTTSLLMFNDTFYQSMVAWIGFERSIDISKNSCWVHLQINHVIFTYKIYVWLRWLDPTFLFVPKLNLFTIWVKKNGAKL